MLNNNNGNIYRYSHKFFYLTLCKSQWIFKVQCSTCRKHFPVLSSCTTYHRICNQINTTGATSGTGTAYPSGAHEYIPGFSQVRVTPSLVLCVMFCRRLFVSLSFVPLTIVVLAVLRLTYSDYPFGIFKVILKTKIKCHYSSTQSLCTISENDLDYILDRREIQADSCGLVCSHITAKKYFDLKDP